MKDKIARINWGVFLTCVFLIILGIYLVSAVSWNGAQNTPYFGTEDSPFFRFLSSDISDPGEDMIFSITSEGGNKLFWNGEETNYSTISSWVEILNESSGNFTIDATGDDQTGFFRIPFKVAYDEGASGQIVSYNFTINATNDAPEITLNETYTFNVNTQENISGEITLFGTDEEEHYPLTFHNITFFENCEPANWSSRKDASNCSFNYEVENIYGDSDQTILLNLTNLGYYDVGIYPVQICINDTLPDSGLPAYRSPDYDLNQTTCENTTLIIQSTLSVDVSNCDDLTLSEDEFLTCNITINTQGKNNNLSIESVASLKNYPSAPSGSFDPEWLYAPNETNAEDFYLLVPINISLGKTHVGNWTINLSVEDKSDNQSSSSQIDIFINRSPNNSPPSLTEINDVDMSINQLMTIYFNISDNDLLIPDKSLFNETFTINYTASKESEEYGFSNFNITNLGQIIGTNILRARITFLPNPAEVGNYSVNISTTDKEDSSSYTLFNISISNNTAPYWGNASYIFHLNTSSLSAEEEGFNFYKNLTNSSDEDNFWANDDDNDTLAFSKSSTAPPNFNLTAEGIINFTPWKQDVGVWTFNLTASDGYLESVTAITLNISNNNSAPQIVALRNNTDSGEPPTDAIQENNTQIVPHGEPIFWRLYTYDDDFLINESKIEQGAYNETLAVLVNITNLTPAGTLTSEDINFLIEQHPRELTGYLNRIIYNTTFTPNYTHVGNYSVNITVTDFSGEKTSRFFYLNITEFDYPPSIINESLANVTKTIYESLFLDINATDEIDGNDTTNGNLTFSISNLTEGGNFINSSNFNEKTGVINLTNLSGCEGEWEFNISVNDTAGNIDWRIFKLSVHGLPVLIFPPQDSVFNFTEAEEGNLTLSFNNSLGGNFSYELWIDNITCGYQNNSDCNYTDFYLIDSFENLGNSTEFNHSWVPNYTDETYGNLKNLTIKIRPSTDELNESQKESVAANFSFKLNISHTNSPVSFIANIGDYQRNYNQNLEIDLKEHFLDHDNADAYYRQKVNFTIHSDANASTLAFFSSVSENWILTIPAPNAVKNERLHINATEENGLTNASSNQFRVEFTEPSKIPTPTPSSGGASTLLKLFSIRIVVPQDIIIYERDSIEIPFLLENTGEVDLKGLNITNIVLFDNIYSEELKVLVEPIYLPELKIGEAQNMTMRILADTQKAGRYKATVYVDVTSPKFHDWGDFFIDLRKINDTEAEQTIIFTEKFVSENPECLELSELLKEARKKFEEGDTENAATIAGEIALACEDAIKANEQVKFKLKDYINNIFYYVLFSTASILLLGFIIYIYKRAKFNKWSENEKKEERRKR